MELELPKEVEAQSVVVLNNNNNNWQQVEAAGVVVASWPVHSLASRQYKLHHVFLPLLASDRPLFRPLHELYPLLVVEPQSTTTQLLLLLAFVAVVNRQSAHEVGGHRSLQPHMDS
jgi:hypothetical protein